MAKAKKKLKKKISTEKKAVPKKQPVVKKKAAPKKKTAPKKKISSKPKPAKQLETTSRSIVLPPEGFAGATEPGIFIEAPVINIPADELIIELCGPNKRCKQKTDGSFIRQNFISGRWVQVGGTRFPSLEACKKACGG